MYVVNAQNTLSSLLTSLFVAYVNWSVFTSLTPTLFYFSVWKLGIAGHEFSLLSTLAPLLLRNPQVFDICASRVGRTVLYALTVTGIAAYALNSPLLRLLIVMLANAALSMGFAIDWSAPLASTSYQGMRKCTIFSSSSLCYSMPVHSGWSRILALFVEQTCESYQQP